MKLIHNPLKTVGMLLASMVAVFSLSGPVNADERLFKALDSDGDGVLTERDAAPLEKVIWVLDEDRSGDLTLSEFKTSASYARLIFNDDTSLDSGMSGSVVLQADTVTTSTTGTDADGVEVTFGGRVTMDVSDDAKSTQITEVTLVTLDLSNPGEVRFQSRKTNITEPADLESVDRLLISSRFNVSPPGED